MIGKYLITTVIYFVATWTIGESVLCEIGEALKDPASPLIDRQCFEGAVPCPPEYVCTPQTGTAQPLGSICCPSKALACAQPQTIGSACGTAVPVQRYSFDPSQGTCVAFNYGGCFGNYNNFFTKEECERTCFSSLCPRGTPSRVDSDHFQRCQIGSNQCPTNYECVTSAVLSLPGSPSGALCCPTQNWICNEPVQPGTACSLGNQAIHERYYFDPASRVCQVFQYKGCSGNENNFVTLRECQQYCLGGGNSELCPAGSAPAPGTTASNPCTQFSTCPLGYTCQFSPTLRQQYCCSGGTTGSFCPAGTFPQPGTTATSTCVPSFPICQAGFSCQQSPLNSQQWYCCSLSSSGTVCPAGSAPAPGVSVATPCTAFVPCAQGYVCEYSNQNGQYYCCSSRDPNGEMCPYGSNPAPGTTVMNPCTPGSACATGYMCKQNNNGRSYCCSTTNQAQTQLCPSGMIPAPGVTVGTTCSPFGTSCAPGHACQQSPHNQLWYCCTVSSSSSQLCPLGSQPAPGITMQTPCNPNLACQAGFTCQRSPFSGQMYCCSIGAIGGQVCPTGTNPAPGVTISSPCVPGSACAPGYFCQLSTLNNQWYCCSQPSASTQLCPIGWTPAPEANINQPCTTFCRAGYSCQRSPFNGQSYCCQYTGGSSSNLCPAGSTPAPNANINTPCDAGNPCQFGYTCQRSPTNGFSYCCSQSASSQLCPAGTNPPPGTTAANTCSQWSTCPPGYSCQPSPFTGQTYCCSTGGGVSSNLCPVGASPQPGVTQMTPCNNDASCQTGYTCQPSSFGFRYCCSRPSSQLCPFGGTPVMQFGTSQPMTCIPNVQPCQSPYDCQPSSGSTWGVCCQSGGQFSQECPYGLYPYRPQGQTINCGIGGTTPNQQLCQPLAQCVLSPIRGTFTCCSAFARAPGAPASPALSPASSKPTYCKKDGDCMSIKGATCKGQVCECTNGNQPSLGEKCPDSTAVNETKRSTGKI